MTMTVKKLISELEQIENKFLEVECKVTHDSYGTYPIYMIERGKGKVYLYTEDNGDDNT